VERYSRSFLVSPRVFMSVTTFGRRSISSICSSPTPRIGGMAGVDIYKMTADGKAIEHWDLLQEIGGPKKAAHANSMFLRRRGRQ
jgi:hypothetical protein